MDKIFDDSTHSSSVAATDSLIRLADNQSGVSYQGANAKIFVQKNFITGGGLRQEKFTRKRKNAP